MLSSSTNVIKLKLQRRILFICTLKRTLRKKKHSLVSWRVSVLEEHGIYQIKCVVCIKRQSQSQLIVRSAVMSTVLLCGQERGESCSESYPTRVPPRHGVTDRVGW